MSQFGVVTKLWPSGASLDTGTDETTLTVPPTASFDRHAANFVVSPDGTKNYQFLFWNTGRHVTNKRHVHWDFSVGGWGVWTATKWYGTPGGTGGAAVVDVEPFSIGGNGLITSSGTAIDTAASTIPAGAFPFSGNDHEIGTAGGAVTVAAKNPFASLQFAGWDQLIFGGDDSGEFDETDAGGSPGSPSFFPVGSGTFHVNQNNGANLMALYGNSSRLSIGSVLGNLGNIFTNPGPISIIDPSPEDRLRLSLLQGLLQQSRPVGGEAADLQALTQAVPNMSVDELNAALKSVQTTVALGNTTASAIQAQIKAKTPVK
ncbi:MAG: hypothetical protein WBY44_19465 [Bryobacteraceae bacterium]|jgi:hypothetical protein